MTEQWQGYEYQSEPRRQGSGPVIAAVAVLAILVLALLAAIAYLALRPEGTPVAQQGQGAAASSSSSSSSQSSRPPVTETAYTTPPDRETVTVTRQAPRTGSQRSEGIPAGADSSGWISNSQARCNAGDPAAMIGQTTQASFSICTNPDNGRYYYRGSSGGSGVEIDDPSVSGRSATVINNGVMYSIDSSRMRIYEGGDLISSQPMVAYWVG